MKKKSNGCKRLSSLNALKILLMMKFSIFLILACTLQSFASEVLSQITDRIIAPGETSLQLVLDEIEQETDYRFLYHSETIRDKKVTLDTKNKSWFEILDQIKEASGVDYRVLEDNLIVLTPAKVVQPRTITGTITDEDGEPMVGATVMVKGTTIGTISDTNGNYSLSEVPEDAILVFSYVGMKIEEVVVGTQTNINVTLKEEASAIDELVVIGYGTVLKSDLTGSVSSLQMDETLSSRPIVDFGQSLYGKVAGIQVLKGSGQPGSSSAIQIRGVNSLSAGQSPLIVIDGVQMPEFNLSLINASDIKSIEILKDAASASIYGSRAANGVILITTKSGVAGPSRFEVNYTYSIQQLIKKIDMMNAAEYAQASMDAAQNGWIEQGGDPNAPNIIEARGTYLYMWPEQFEHPETLINTDWQDITYSLAPMHDINLRFTGGNEKANYLLAAGYINQEGIMIGTDYERWNYNLKADAKIGNLFTLGGSFYGIYDRSHHADPWGDRGIGTVQYPPIYPVFSEDGYLGGPHNTPGYENFVSILFRVNYGHPYDTLTDLYENSSFKTYGNFFANIELFKGLNFRTAINPYFGLSNNRTYIAKDHNRGPQFSPDMGSASTSTGQTISYSFENILTFERDMGNHRINILVGQEYYDMNFNQLSGSREDFDDDDIPYLAGGKTITDALDRVTQTRLISQIGRIQYNFMGKYLLLASYRRDGSSKFGPDKKWGNFPSVSAAWRISEEFFMKSLKPTLNQMKLRVSYGLTGNDKFADYRWISRMNQARVAIGNNLVTSYYPSTIENPDLGWERTKQVNIGFDFGLFNNRLIFEVDVYNTRSDNLLLDVPLPETSGFTSVFTNIGEIQNNGLELNINSRNLTQGEFTWSTQVTYSTNNNKIIKLGEDNAPMIFRLPNNTPMQWINQVGKPAFSYYAYKYDGVYMNQTEIENDPAHYSTATPGDGRYLDLNGDGELNADDRTIVGKNTPDFIYGITNMFTYKDFDFSFMIHGSVGMDIHDINFRRSMQYHEGRNYYKLLNNRWRSEDEPGDGYHYKLTTHLDGYERTQSDYWIVDGTYLRLGDVTLGYTMPSEFTQRIGIADARLFFNGVNLFTISNATVNDPENFAGSVENVSSRGASHSPYPSAKIFSIGFNVTF